jgi:hypothetical protein
MPECRLGGVYCSFIAMDFFSLSWTDKFSYISYKKVSLNVVTLKFCVYSTRVKYNL